MATEREKNKCVGKGVEMKVRMMTMQNKFVLQQKIQELEFLRQEIARIREMELRRLYEDNNKNCFIM